MNSQTGDHKAYTYAGRASWLGWMAMWVMAWHTTPW